MIILDTHIWTWWVHDEKRLLKPQVDAIKLNEKNIIGVSIISCWEIAKLVEYDRITLPLPIEEWMDQALSYPGTRLLELTPEIVIESTRLPGEFHRDPADQLIVASARIHDCPLVTSDRKIQKYKYVNTIT